MRKHANKDIKLEETECDEVMNMSTRMRIREKTLMASQTHQTGT